MRLNGTSTASLPQKIPAGNPQIAGGPKAGWNIGFRPAPVGETPQRNTGRAMVLKVGATSKPWQRIPQNPHPPPLSADSPRHFAADLQSR